MPFYIIALTLATLPCANSNPHTTVASIGMMYTGEGET